MFKKIVLKKILNSPEVSKIYEYCKAAMTAWQNQTGAPFLSLELSRFFYLKGIIRYGTGQAHLSDFK